MRLENNQELKTIDSKYNIVKKMIFDLASLIKSEKDKKLPNKDLLEYSHILNDLKNLLDKVHYEFFNIELLKASKDDDVTLNQIKDLLNDQNKKHQKVLLEVKKAQRMLKARLERNRSNKR